MTTDHNGSPAIADDLAGSSEIVHQSSRHKALRAVVDAFGKRHDVVVACPTHQQAGYVLGVLLDTFGLAEVAGVGVRRAAGSLAIFRTHTDRAHSIQVTTHRAGGIHLRGRSAELAVLFNPSADAIAGTVPVVMARPGGRVLIVRASS